MIDSCLIVVADEWCGRLDVAVTVGCDGGLFVVVSDACDGGGRLDVAVVFVAVTTTTIEVCVVLLSSVLFYSNLLNYFSLQPQEGCFCSAADLR